MKELVVVEKPNSTFSEGVKKIRTNLMFSNVNDDIKVVMITSSIPGEGKSFISTNLAATFAQANEKVLLIDCDLRKGRLRKIFNIAPEVKGLSDLLINKKWKEEYKDYIEGTEVDKLSVIVSGSYPPNPSELLASNRFEELLQELRKSYNMIILDCPPIVGLNDAIVLGKKADRSILIANVDRVSMEVLEKSKNELEKMNIKIAGVVLNNLENKGNKYYYYGYGTYYRDE